jgi:hypothetical protein
VVGPPCFERGARLGWVVMSATIEIRPLDGTTWRVEVRAASATAHDVTVPAGYLEKLGLTGVAVPQVLEESFRFLLEREPNTSILRRFDLPVIARYFPEYETVIAERLRDGRG